MKHKKDLARKYRKYVKWAIFDEHRKMPVNTFMCKKYAMTVAKANHRDKKGWTVEPVLCLPLSMIAAPNFNWSIFGVDDEEYAALVKPDFNGPQNGPVDA